MAAGLGAVFGTAAVMLSTFFNNKKKPELNQKETERIEEKPMLAAVRPQSVGRCPVAASSENVKPDKPSIGEQVKKEVQQPRKCDETASVDKVAEVEIMSIPDLSKIPQDESVVPIQPDVHFEAVTAIEEQIENQIVEAVKEIEKMVQVEKEEEEEEKEEEEEEVEELCYPVKPATFSEQVLAAREIIESSPVVSPVPELTTEKEVVQVEEEEEEDEMVVVKAVATTEAASAVKTEEIQTPESTKVAVPVKEEEISVPAVESEIIVNNSTVVETAIKEVAVPVNIEEISVVNDSAAPDTAITAAITEASIPTEQPKSVEVEEEEEEEEEDEEDSMVILPSAVEVAKTQEPEKKVEEVKPTPIVTPAKEPEIKQEEEEEEYEDEEEEEEEEVEVEEKIIAKTPVVAAVVEAPIIKKPETKAEEEEEEYEEYEEDEEEEEKKDEKKKESNIQESMIRVAAEVAAVTAEVKPPTEPVKN